MNDQTLQTLYDSDFQGWIEKTIDCLENQQFNRLDIQHLIEELTDLGRSDRKALESNLALPPTVWKVYNSNTTVGGGVCG